MRIPRWRVLTWFILAVNVLFMVWIIAGVNGTRKNCAGLTGPDLQACQAGTAVGAGIGVALIVFFWAAVDIILGIIWLVTNRRDRTCPQCGNRVKPDLVRCRKCGYDFRQQPYIPRAGAP